MANLPFVVKPRREPIIEVIGSEESGKLEIERRGYLSTGEKAFVQQVRQYDDASTDAVTLTRRVARKYSLGMDRAYRLIMQIISGAAGLDEEGNNTADAEENALIDAIETEYAQELTAVVKALSASETREDIIFATCMLRYRVNEDIEINDVARQHPDLISALAKLYRDEEQRSIEAFLAREGAEAEQAAEPKQTLEEAEKKPERSSRSRSKTTTGA
jgi:hypothetical protein